MVTFKLFLKSILRAYRKLPKIKKILSYPLRKILIACVFIREYTDKTILP
ncbi:hypothetical protein SAMN04487908_1553 [Aequorivita viscosa]|uniref:Uncharacterized protein n=1 Tax=Aequorivita viscosa TaxID=797419 RepID=A0A1M6PQW0_9FLAO|nr:hypothetical protein SAMN04487908_1553 [Aequorivita viscosa]